MNKKQSKVLVVDDNPHILSSLPQLLSEHFDAVRAVDNPNLIQNEMEKMSFDIILLDMKQAAEGEHGPFAFLQKIHRSDPNVMVVLMTGGDDADLAAEGLKQGAADFVLKPWNPQKLIANLRMLLRLKHLENQLAGHIKMGGRKQKDESLNLNDVEKRYIAKALFAYQGNLSHAARQLGITRATLYAKMKKYGLQAQ